MRAAHGVVHAGTHPPTEEGSNVHAASWITITSGGRPAVLADGRPLPITVAECRAVIDDRSGVHQCRRNGGFALEANEGGLIQPLCATHLRQLRSGGVVAA
jgi:hypothetical protein